MDVTVEGGFADSVFGAQAAFRAIMEALARPGTVQALGAGDLAALPAPPLPLTPELGAVALTLVDHDTPLWLDAALRDSDAVTGWLKFHCGAVLTDDPAKAAFALVSDPAALPGLSSFAQGTDEYPDRSTTIAIAGAAKRRVRLEGPGIRTAFDAELPLPNGDFLAQWAVNRARFPRGVDLLLLAPGMVSGLPRTTRILEGSTCM